MGDITLGTHVKASKEMCAMGEIIISSAQLRMNQNAKYYTEPLSKDGVKTRKALFEYGAEERAIVIADMQVRKNYSERRAGER